MTESLSDVQISPNFSYYYKKKGNRKIKFSEFKTDLKKNELKN